LCQCRRFAFTLSTTTLFWSTNLAEKISVIAILVGVTVAWPTASRAHQPPVASPAQAAAEGLAESVRELEGILGRRQSVQVR
jgi:hypothetical protein